MGMGFFFMHSEVSISSIYGLFQTPLYSVYSFSYFQLDQEMSRNLSNALTINYHIFVGRQLCWKDHLVFICHVVCLYGCTDVWTY